MAACSVVGCVGLAVIDGRCAVHAAGYCEHDGASELRCGNCRRLFRKHETYRRVEGVVTHAKPCKAHPDLLKERAKAGVS